MAVTDEQSEHASDPRETLEEDETLSIDDSNAIKSPEVEKVAMREGGRFREIVKVLMDHDIMKGLTPEKLCSIFMDLGPTYVKIGQIMSMRPDMLPQDYCNELAKLRSDVAPMSINEVRQALKDTYGDQLKSIFDHIDAKPLGSASIAQAHSAQLLDGQKVVLKIQRPGVYKKMAEDISMLRRATRLLKLAPGTVVGDVVDFQGFIDEMWVVAQEEMDFLVEAKHTDEFANLNKNEERIEVPKIFHEYTASKVLMMEYIDGCSVEDTDKLVAMGYDCNELGTILLENYVKQITVDGFFHADPHPGNVWVRDDNIVWIDLGMTGHLSARDRGLVNDAIVAVAEGNVSALKDVVLSLGLHSDTIDHAKLYADVEMFLSRYSSSDIGELNLADIMQELLGIAKSNEISMPSSVSMLARGIATIEGTLASLSPDVSMVEVLKKQVLNNEVDSFSPTKKAFEISRKMYRSTSKAVEMPGLATDLMKSVMRGQTKMNMELSATDEFKGLVRNSIDKIVVGLVIAAFLIGSSFICTTNMDPKILGVPALGFIGYLIALILGVWIFIDMNRRH